MSEKEEFPIGIRLVDLQNNRISYRQLTLDEFLKVAAILSPIEWVDIK